VGGRYRLSRNLSWSEVLRGSGYSSRDDVPADVRARIEWAAVEVFQPLRDAWDGPLRTVSAIRSVEVNRACGGAKRSRHVVGDAFDIRPKDRWRLLELYDLADAMQRDGRLPPGGLGVYWWRGKPRFFHIDGRGRRARWNAKHLAALRAGTLEHIP